MMTINAILFVMQMMFGTSTSTTTTGTPTHDNNVVVIDQQIVS